MARGASAGLRARKAAEPVPGAPVAAASATGPFLPLFVSADRPDLFAGVCTAGADAVVIDFEDSVPPESKALVRRIPQSALPAERPVPIYLRVNAPGTPWYRDDVAFARGAGFEGVVLPKVESAAQLGALREALGERQTIIALIETVPGLARVEEIACAADRIAFGSLDICEDLGCAHTRMALLPLRSRMVQGARLAGRPAPLDGVTVSVVDAALIREEAMHAGELGFGGKCLIHPRQIAPARAGFGTEQPDLDWARNVIAAEAGELTAADEAALMHSPVVARARRLLKRGTAGS